LESTSDVGKPDTWFHYELNVKNWLANNGFEIQRLAANKRGDGGVDIQAQKGNENLLVQCKYWLREKIGPSVIREMLGTLQTFPAGSRGVIVTCSELTEGARQLAIENGIQFIERADFHGVIDAKF
jgi:HJR/Mrr/RecB family endonuclease